MNLQTLDKKLREITPHEAEYKDNKQNPSINDFNTIDINGESIYYIHLKDLIEYKGGPLISIKKHSRFQTFPLHCHDGVEINYIYSGTCQQIINGQTYTLSKGQTLFLDSDTIHTITPLGEDDILININVEKDFLTANFFNRFSSDSVLTNFFFNSITQGVKHDNFLLFHSENSERLLIYIGELLCEWYNPSIVSTDIMESLFTLIISELVIVYKDNFTDNLESMKKSPIIPILRYIEKNYSTCSLSEVAKFFNLNPNYLSNTLKKHTGYSYRQLIQQQKLQSAKQLLKSSKIGISEIANMVGYENVSFFYKKFKEYYHCLPSKYRNNIY